MGCGVWGAGEWAGGRGKKPAPFLYRQIDPFCGESEVSGKDRKARSAKGTAVGPTQESSATVLRPDRIGL